MLIDSHCHLNHLDLEAFDNKMDNVLKASAEEGVKLLLSVCVELTDYPDLKKLAATYPNVFISVGLHPTEMVEKEPSASLLVTMADYPKCIAIGETGLDFYRVKDEKGQENQKNRFREHIRASIATKKPLIIHTREAPLDTIAVLQEEEAQRIGGVMHCFTESWDIAKRALDMNFYISLSGIVTFKNADIIQDVAKKVPLDRLLIETDAPYLAPHPYRGKQNHPALVKYVAMAIANLRGCSYEEIAEATSRNFFRCFRLQEDLA